MTRTIILYCLLLNGLAVFSQPEAGQRFKLKIVLDDGRSYSQSYRHLQEMIDDPELLKLGVTYQEGDASFKIHGDGSFFINDLGAYVANQQFEALQIKYGRYGTEHEVKEVGQDSLCVVNVFWKNGKRYPIDKRTVYIDQSSNIDAVLLENKSEKAAERQEIVMGKSLSWERESALGGGAWGFGESKAKVTVINFWFVGCKPCVEEMPELNRLAEKYAGEGVEFIAFGLDTEADIKRFLAKTPFRYQIIPNAKTTAQRLGVFTFPTHLVLDRKGAVRYHHEGYEPGIGQQLAQVIDGLLGKGG